VKVRMKVQMSGTRQGEDWPGFGEVLECSDEEGASLLAGGLADPYVKMDSDVETAVAPKAEERAGGLTTETGPVKRGTHGKDKP